METIGTRQDIFIVTLSASAGDGAINVASRISFETLDSKYKRSPAGLND